MSRSNHIPIDDIRQCLEYDPSLESGLKWKVARSNKRVGDPAGTLMNHGYYRIRFNTGLYLTHRVIWSLFNGPIPEDMEIDHIDRNRNNNSIENLRCVSRTLNIRNKGMLRNNTSGTTGVNYHIHSKAWHVRWHDIDGIRRMKSFSDKKYGGKDSSYDAAVKFRNAKIDELRESGSGHTETYGK